jgi:methionyl-tRNA formyltransferase
MGTPEFSVVALQALIDAGHEIACVYSQPPRPAKRGQKERPSPVHAHAEANGLPVRTPLSFRDPAERDAFAALDADVAVVVAYGLILPQAVLDAPARGCLNIHASLLPRWRGAAPIHRAIEAGDAETGVGIMQMEAGLDTGPVLLEERLSIGASETTGQLHDRLAALGGRLIVSALAQLETLILAPQPETGASYAHKIDKAETRILWADAAPAVARRINAFSPFPGAWFELGGERVKALQAEPANGSGEPGEVLAGDGLVVACGEGVVRLLTVQRAGKKAGSAEDFLRGNPLAPGTVLA